MEQITYTDFVKNYKPITNTFFPKGKFNGTFFALSDLYIITDFVRSKQIWTILHTSHEESLRALPGIIGSPQAVGYFACSTKYELPNIEIIDIPKEIDIALQDEQEGL